MQVSLPMTFGVLFIALKLTGVIAWSWVWVLAPFWIAALVVILLLVLFGSVALVVPMKEGPTLYRLNRRSR